MKKQLSTAMAAAMAFGTVVPAFTNVASAATVNNIAAGEVDLSKAFTFLTVDEKGNVTTVDAKEVATNGAPVLTRDQVYNYNGANANERDKHTLKTEFAKEGVVLIHEERNTQDASKDLFVFARVNDSVLKQEQLKKNAVDAQVELEAAVEGNSVKTFDRDTDFVISKSNGNYVYSNAYIQGNYGDQAAEDAKIELARELVNGGLNIIGGTAQIQTFGVEATTTTTITDIQADLQAQIQTLNAYLETVNTNLSTLRSNMTNISSTVSNTETLATKSNLQAFVDSYVTIPTVTNGKIELTLPLSQVASQVVYVDSSNKTDLLNLLEAKKAKLTEEINIKTELMEADSAKAEKMLNKVLEVVNNANTVAASDLRAALEDAFVTTTNTSGATTTIPTKCTFLTLKDGKLQLDNSFFMEYGSSVTYLQILNAVQNEIIKFFGGNITTNTFNLVDYSKTSLLKELIGSYAAEIKGNKLVPGRTVKIVFNGSYVETRDHDNNTATEEKQVMYFYNNEYKEYKETAVSTLRNELFKDLVNIENGVNVYLDGELKEDGTTEAKSNYFTLNFDTMTMRNEAGDDFLPQKRTVTAEEDRQVYHAANLLKYKLENMKDIIVETNEYGGKNQHQLTKVYVKNSDGTKGDLALTIDFKNTIEVRKNVSGQPSIVNMPNVEKTDFANITWAKDEIVNAMLAGYIDATDTFRPSDSITRAEFAKIVCTVFGVETKDEAIKNLVNPFSDVKEGEWHYRYIVALYNEGTKGSIINGRADGTFDPKAEITRQEAAKMVAAAYDLYREALNTTGEHSVENKMDGVVEKVVAVNGQTIHVDTLTSFADDKEIASWADESVTALVKENVINGYEDNTFKPNNKINRVEALYMLVKTNKITADDSDIK